jgi:hypothetical protein
VTGSYFNIYVQTVRRKDKGVQLGIYLHRQSMLEPLPAASRPPRKADRGRSLSALTWSESSPAISMLPPGHSRVRNPEHSLAMHRTMSVTPVGTHTIAGNMSPPGGVVSDEEAMDPDEPGHVTSPTMTGNRDGSGLTNSPASPYRDPRKTAKVRTLRPFSYAKRLTYTSRTTGLVCCELCERHGHRFDPVQFRTGHVLRIAKLGMEEYFLAFPRILVHRSTRTFFR